MLHRRERGALGLGILLMAAAGCRGGGATPATPATPGAAPDAWGLRPTDRAALGERRDRHSHAEPGRVRVRHVALDLTLDFAAKVVRGSADLTVVRTDPAAPLVLDTLGLAIKAVVGADGKPRGFALGQEQPALGAPLTITLAPGDERVKITYETTARAEAVQWWPPSRRATGSSRFSSPRVNRS